MKPGFHVEAVASDLGGTPSHRAAENALAAWLDEPELRTGTLVAVTPTSPTSLWISLLRAGETGRGHGGRALAILCAACDDEDVVLELRSGAIGGPEARPFGGLDQSALDAFYQRRGFVATGSRGGQTTMAREPAPSASLRDQGACIARPDRATFVP